MEANAAQEALEIVLDLHLQEAWIHRHCSVGVVEAWPFSVTDGSPIFG